MSNDSDLILFTTRRIPASPELVFQAFQDPVQLARWWGPRGFRNTFHHFDFKSGGTWDLDMVGPDGTSYPNHWAFEAVESGRIVLRHIEPVHSFRLEITFGPEEGGTRINWRMAFPTAAACEEARRYAPKCNEENFDRMEAVLGKMTGEASGEHELRLVRIIDASPDKVYRAWMDEKLLVQWFTPPPWVTISAVLDVRPGGSQMVIMRGPDGTEMPHRGVYLEVVPNKRLVSTDAYTSAWEPSEKPFMTTILTFEDLGGRTRYTARVVHWSSADRVAHEKMGFHEGWGIATDQLALVASRL